jgi:hypothetical protein
LSDGFRPAGVGHREGDHPAFPVLHPVGRPDYWPADGAVQTLGDHDRSDMTGRVCYRLGDSRMEWTLRLVGTEIDGQSRSCKVMAISRPDGLGEIAAWGLTLAEAKQLLVQVQQEVVAAQARQQTLFRPDCQSCSGRCHLKGWRAHQIATLFGEVRVKLSRLACAGGGCGETGTDWPSHCRSTPELDRLQARLSALMPYRVAALQLQRPLPDDALMVVARGAKRDP